MACYFVPMVDNAVKTRKFLGWFVLLVDLCELVLTPVSNFLFPPFSIALLFLQLSRL